mmetsp:Transcript_70568/g.142094  ORF Transcript_70568/g.142094 Transcript_70568/m.142094 type:complete len:234 (-) Transcript_70568:982-1683(-)
MMSPYIQGSHGTTSYTFAEIKPPYSVLMPGRIPDAQSGSLRSAGNDLGSTRGTNGTPCPLMSNTFMRSSPTTSSRLAPPVVSATAARTSRYGTSAPTPTELRFDVAALAPCQPRTSRSRAASAAESGASLSASLHSVAESLAAVIAAPTRTLRRSRECHGDCALAPTLTSGSADTGEPTTLSEPPPAGSTDTGEPATLPGTPSAGGSAPSAVNAATTVGDTVPPTGAAAVNVT